MTDFFNRAAGISTESFNRTTSQMRGFLDDQATAIHNAIKDTRDECIKKIYQKLNMLLPYLTESEKEFIYKHPVAATNFISNASIALVWTSKNFSEETLHNGSGDAFRHCFWSALNASAHGKVLAKMYGDAHESFDWNPKDEMEMDKFNNSVGFEIGAPLKFASLWHLATLCAEAWRDGKLKQITPANSSDALYSGEIGEFIYSKAKK